MKLLLKRGDSIPIIINSFDDEAKGWADIVDVFLHNPLDDGCLPSVVQATKEKLSNHV